MGSLSTAEHAAAISRAMAGASASPDQHHELIAAEARDRYGIVGRLEGREHARELVGDVFAAPHRRPSGRRYR